MSLRNPITVLLICLFLSFPALLGQPASADGVTVVVARGFLDCNLFLNNVLINPLGESNFIIHVTGTPEMLEGTGQDTPLSPDGQVNTYPLTGQIDGNLVVLGGTITRSTADLEGLDVSVEINLNSRDVEVTFPILLSPLVEVRCTGSPQVLKAII